jgi:glycosyl transferase family 2
LNNGDLNSLSAGWREAVAGNARAQAGWEIVDGGKWLWQHVGVRVQGTGPEWIALRWLGWNAESARMLKNFLIEVTISGNAGAAGLSFGGFKDFLVALDSQTAARRLQLELDVEANRWAFRVNGKLMQRCWWDAAVTSVEDILNGEFRLKVRYADEVVFQDLAVQFLQASCELSIIITCSRFLQRLRLSLRNWCHQDLPSGMHEVLVVNPQSPDGTHEHLAAVARSYPHVRVREIAVENDLIKNKGAMINRAFAASRGEWIWLTDADCLFGPGCARQPERHHWGYTQIVHHSTLSRVQYGENQNHFAHTDGIFADACRREGVLPKAIEGLFCLHLDHPFSWYGTSMFL